MNRSTRACLVALSILCGASGVARAEDKAASDGTTEAAALQNARDLYRRGVEKFEQGLDADAYALFKASWSLHPHYTTAGNLASCEMKLGKPRDAAAHLAFALREMPADFADRPNYEATYAQARSRVGAIVIEADDGEEVYLDDVSLGRAPFLDPVFVEPGAHTLRAKATRSVVVQAGEETHVALEVLPGNADATEPSGMSPIVPIGIGLAVIGVGAGVALAVLSTSHGGDADDALAGLKRANGRCASKPPTGLCKDIEDHLGARDELATGAAIAFSVGGAIGVGTLIYALTQKKSPSTEKSVSVSPVVTPFGGSLTVVGRF